MRNFRFIFTIITLCCWSILSIILTIFDSLIIARFWQISQFLLIGFAVFTIFTKTDIFFNKIVRFLLGWAIYVSFVNIFFADNVYNSLINVLIEVNWFPLLFILFYSIFKYDKFGLLYNKIVRGFPFFYYTLYFVVFYKMINQTGFNFSGSFEVGEINSVFWILLTIPFVFLIDNKLIKYLILFSSFILILLSTKRSATIAISFVFLFSLVSDFFTSKISIANVLFISVFLVISFFTFNQILSKIDVSVLRRFEETSIYEEARYDILRDSWQRFQRKNIIFKIFGSGHRSTANDRGFDVLSLTAHNDFLEVLYNYGYIGLILYIYFIFQIIQVLFKLKKFDKKYIYAYLSSIVIFLIMSSVSHLVIYPTYYTFILIFWVLIESRIRTQQEYFKNYSSHHVP